MSFFSLWILCVGEEIGLKYLNESPPPQEERLIFYDHFAAGIAAEK